MRCFVTTMVLLAGMGEAHAQPPGLRAPAGFEVAEFADDKLANDIFCLTFDPKGRVVVSGRGYIRTLVDDDGDGRADRAIEFASGPKDGAHGMLWEGSTLYFTGDGGLRRYHDKDGDGRADGPSELLRKMRTGNEHDAHAIRRGPDGWLYVLCGNFTGIDKSYATVPTSPITEPVAGCVLRLSPNLKESEIVADGFRNAYGMDFNPEGELFTYDSDNERCVSLPWYEPTRFYHVIPGGHYGWQAPQRASFWRLPPYFPDVVAPVTTLGRGSPTGVVCYRHAQFPEKYRGGFFALDWTFGKVWFLRLEQKGASYTANKEVFLEAVGDNGFAPTAAAVHPDTGDLYISVGGRGTRGAVYRVRYPKGLKPGVVAEALKLQPRPHSLDWRLGLEQELLKEFATAKGLDRLRGLLAVRRHATRLPKQHLRQYVLASWNDPDPHLRRVAAELIALLPEKERGALAAQAGTTWQQVTFAFGVFRTDPADALAHARRALVAQEATAEARLAAVRAAQLALGSLTAKKTFGTVWEGYTLRNDPSEARVAKHRADLLAALRPAYPSGHSDLDRELSRTLALLADDDPITQARVAERLTTESDPTDDLHNLAVLARLPGPRPAAIPGRIADALLSLDEKAAKRRINRDSNWPLRLVELYEELTRKDPKLHAALLVHPEFGRPEHALFARAAQFDRSKAAERFLDRAKKDANYLWNAGVVEVVGSLPPDKALPVLRPLWGKAGLNEALLPVLARHAEALDRPKFVQGLASPQLRVLRVSLEALEKLPPSGDGPEVLALLQALGRVLVEKEGAVLREAIVRHLEKVTGQKHGTDRQAWTAWFTQAYPKLAARLSNPDGVDVAAWGKRLAKLDWSAGDVEPGKQAFLKASCANCHSGSQAVGPDLQGVAGRFARDDLFTAILQPSRDVSARYQTTLVETTDGKTYQGLVIYEAVDGVILQTGPAATVRVAGERIASRRVTPVSLMPAGLLDALANQEIVDLYAYLRSLGKLSKQ